MKVLLFAVLSLSVFANPDFDYNGELYCAADYGSALVFAEKFQISAVKENGKRDIYSGSKLVAKDICKSGVNELTCSWGKLNLLVEFDSLEEIWNGISDKLESYSVIGEVEKSSYLLGGSTSYTCKQYIYSINN